MEMPQNITIAPCGDRSPSERLLDLALRCALHQGREIPWALLAHLAELTLKREDPAHLANDTGASAGPARRAAIGRGLAIGIASRIRNARHPAAAVVPLLPLLWRLDRRHGVHPFDDLAAFLPDGPQRDGTAFCEVSGHALLRLLRRHDRSAEAVRDGGVLLLRDLINVAALPLSSGTNGRLDWPALTQGIYRHLRLCREVGGAAAVARWLRACPSRTALQYVVHADILRDDPLVIATLLLRGTAREMALGMAALRSAPPETGVRAAVARLVATEPWLGAARLACLFELHAELPAREAELLDALLSRAAEARQETGPTPVTSDARLPEHTTGQHLVALLTEGAGLLDLPGNRTLADTATELLALVAGILTRRENVPRLLADARLGGPEERSSRRDRWASAVARSLVTVWRRDALQPIGSAPFGRTLTASFARMEMALHFGTSQRRAPSWGPRGLAMIALHVARALPETVEGRAQGVALLELILRLRRVHTASLARLAQMNAVAELLERAPDPLDDAKADDLSDFLEQWLAAERGEALSLPEPDGVQSGGDHTLGVAQLSA